MTDKLDSAPLTSVEKTIDLDEYERIYCIDGPDKMYVGRCKLADGRVIEDRLKEHLKATTDNSRCAPKLRDAIIEHGKDAFSIRGLEVCHRDVRMQREIFWIEELNTVYPNGYNLMGGDESGYKHHEETIKKIGDGRRGFHKKDWVENEHSRATVQLVRTNVDEGYRGFYNGVPKYYMSQNFSMEQKKALALEWHLFGKTQYEFRLPRERKHVHPEDSQMPTGVKYDVKHNLRKPYRAYRPQLQNVLKSPYFATLDEAAAYVKLVTSFPANAIPAEYLTTPRNPDDEKDEFLLYIKPKKHLHGTSTVAKGTLVGYEVRIPEHATLCGELVKDCFMETKYYWDQNLASAIVFRAEHIKPNMLPPEPEWVKDLPPPIAGPDMRFIQSHKLAKGTKTIPKGTVIGWNAIIPASYSKSGADEKAFFNKTSLSEEDNLQAAFTFRWMHVKEGFTDFVPENKELPEVYAERKVQYITKYKSSGTKAITKGTQIGWVVEVPASRAISNSKIRQKFRADNQSLDQCLVDAIAFRDENIKQSV